VHGHIVQHAYRTYFLGDLDYCHVRRKNIGAGAEGVTAAEIQLGLHAWRELCGVVGSRDELGEGDVVLEGVLREDSPVLEADICHRGIEQVGGNQGEFLAGLLQHDVQRGAGARRCTW
jgi:hypothetical protein